MKDIYSISNMGDLRYRIAYTLEQLMQNKTIDQVSVNDIADTCGISRTSFYRYFPDKYEVVLWIFKAHIDSAIETPAVFSERTAEVFTLMQDKRSLFRGSFSREHQNSLIDDIQRRSKTYMCATIKEALNAAELPNELEFAVDLYCHGARSVWKKYVFGNLNTSPSIMAELLLESMLVNVRTFFK